MSSMETSHKLVKAQLLAPLVKKVKEGVYTVPSSSEPGVRWTVIATETGLQCTCKAAQFAMGCSHKAAVHIRKFQEAEKRQRRTPSPDPYVMRFV